MTEDREMTDVVTKTEGTSLIIEHPMISYYAPDFINTV